MTKQDPRKLFFEVWQPRTKCELSDEDAREIAENLVGFFRVLREWNAADKAKQETAEQKGGSHA